MGEICIALTDDDIDALKENGSVTLPVPEGIIDADPSITVTYGERDMQEHDA